MKGEVKERWMELCEQVVTRKPALAKHRISIFHVVPAHRQERFLEIIAKPKKRAKLLVELSHFKALNPKFMAAIPSNQQNPLALAKPLSGEKC